MDAERLAAIHAEGTKIRATIDRLETELATWRLKNVIAGELAEAREDLDLLVAECTGIITPMTETTQELSE